jgi:hypothetical protein
MSHPEPLPPAESAPTPKKVMTADETLPPPVEEALPDLPQIVPPKSDPPFAKPQVWLNVSGKTVAVVVTPMFPSTTVPPTGQVLPGAEVSVRRISRQTFTWLQNRSVPAGTAGARDVTVQWLHLSDGSGCLYDVFPLDGKRMMSRIDPDVNEMCITIEIKTSESRLGIVLGVDHGDGRALLTAIPARGGYVANEYPGLLQMGDVLCDVDGASFSPFASIDTNHDNVLSKDELEAAMKTLGRDTSPAAMATLWDKLDINHHGVVNIDEMKGVIALDILNACVKKILSHPRPFTMSFLRPRAAACAWDFAVVSVWRILAEVVESCTEAEVPGTKSGKTYSRLTLVEAVAEKEVISPADGSTIIWIKVKGLDGDWICNRMPAVNDEMIAERVGQRAQRDTGPKIVVEIGRAHV